MGGTGIIIILAVIIAAIVIAVGACALLGIAIFVILKNNKVSAAKAEDASTDSTDIDAEVTEGENEEVKPEDGAEEADAQDEGSAE